MEIYLQKLHICWANLRYAILILCYLTLSYPYKYFTDDSTILEKRYQLTLFFVRYCFPCLIVVKIFFAGFRFLCKTYPEGISKELPTSSCRSSSFSKVLGKLLWRSGIFDSVCFFFVCSGDKISSPA